MFSFFFPIRCIQEIVSHVMLWHLPFVDALKPSSGHLVPVAWVFLHFWKKSAILLLASLPFMGFMWKPETPSTMISAGPPRFVAKVVKPQFIASITVSPNAS